MTGKPVDLDALPPEEALQSLRELGETVATENAWGDVRWHLWGAGPPLVLLHGGYGTWAHWVRVIKRLSARYRLLVPDMPGFGESAAPPPPHDAETITAPLVAGLERLLRNDERPSIAGFSFGGVIAGHMAAQLGARVEALVLVAPGGLGARRGDMPELLARDSSMSPEQAMAAHRRNLEILMFADPARIDALALHIQAGNTALHRIKSRPISSTDTLARALRHVPARKAAIWGEQDATAGAYLSQRRAILHDIDPALDFRVMPGTGHWVMYEAPDAFAALLLELLSGGTSVVGETTRKLP